MSLSLEGPDIYALDQILEDLTTYWKGTFQGLPSDFSLTPVFLQVLPTLKSIYRWSVRLTSSSHPITDPHWKFYFTHADWHNLILLIQRVAEQFLEISPLLPAEPPIVKKCFAAAQDHLLILCQLLESWETIIAIP